MFICAFVLAVICREFPRYKLSYELKLRMTQFCKENSCNNFCFQFFMLNSRKLIARTKCVTLTILSKKPRKIDKYFPSAKSNLCENSFTHLKHFLTFLLFVFIEKQTDISAKYPRKLRLRDPAIELTLITCVWGSRGSTFPLVDSLKRPINYNCRIFAILCTIFKKHPFIEALGRPLFTKYAHSKPLFLLQNNA